MPTNDQKQPERFGEGERSRPCESEQHREAVIRAEINRLVRALSPYGVLRRHALAREARAEAWHDESFERALQAAVDAGKIERLPLDFYRLSHGRPANGTGADDGRNAA